MNLEFLIGCAVLGGFIGIGVLNLMALIAKNGREHHDIVTFTSTEELWPKIEDWATQTGYKLKQENGKTRLYQKGKNMLTAPMMLDVIQEGEQWTLRAYIQINGLIVKGDMALSKKGLVASLPRMKGKKEINELLSSLGQPLIK